jgi:hypothetical protein
MKSSVERPLASRAGARAAMNRLAFATVVLAVIAIFTAICIGAVLAASLLSMS